MPGESEESVVTELAPCGLTCVKCESYLLKNCPGCYSANTEKKKCPVLTGTPFEASKRLILCLIEKDFEKCSDCDEFEICDTYEAMLMTCPFKKPEYDLKPGFTYLVKEKKPELSLEMFVDMVRHGSSGLCLSRQHPKYLKEKVLKGSFDVYWLTSMEGRNNIDPTNLGILRHVFIRFIEENERAVVILDGLELLITHNDFPKVLRVINNLIEQVMQKNVTFILSIDERTLDERELALLERNMEIVKRKESPDSKKVQIS